MTWRYQATHRTIKTPLGPVDVFEVREVYEDLNDDGSIAWTDSTIAPVAETKEELIEVLRMMLKDVQHFDVLEVDEP